MCIRDRSTAASAAVQNALLAKNDCYADTINGIVNISVDDTIRNLGKVSNLGMGVTDTVILGVMNDMNKVR